MAHRERFMQEIQPGHWVVQCRICPKRAMPRLGYEGSKRSFSSSKDCHDWWRGHEGTERHRSNKTDEGRERRLHDSALQRMSMDELVPHLVACSRCSGNKS